MFNHMYLVSSAETSRPVRPAAGASGDGVGPDVEGRTGCGWGSEMILSSFPASFLVPVISLRLLLLIFDLALTFGSSLRPPL